MKILGNSTINSYKKSLGCLLVFILGYILIVSVQKLNVHFYSFHNNKYNNIQAVNTAPTVLPSTRQVVNKKKLILLFNKRRWIPYHVNFSTCSVSNCVYTTNERLLRKSDAVIIHDASNLKLLPKQQGQVWIYHVHEPPHRVKNLSAWNNLFNWTFTYRRDSDFPSLYGEIIPLNGPANKDWMKYNKTKTAAWFVGHCKTPSKRFQYTNLLRKHVAVDIYGRCGNLSCKGHFLNLNNECDKLLEEKYKFYLGFENELCRDYVTEKAFRSYRKSIVPILRGHFNYDLYFPNDSYIATSNYQNISEMNRVIQLLDNNQRLYDNYFKSRQNYMVRSKDGGDFYPQYLFCNLCSKLNGDGNDDTRVYSNIEQWFHGTKDVPMCTEPNDV